MRRQKYFIVGHNKNIACKFMKQTVMDVVFLAVVLLLDEEDDIREKYNQVERVWVKPILRKQKSCVMIRLLSSFSSCQH